MVGSSVITLTDCVQVEILLHCVQDSPQCPHQDTEQGDGGRPEAGHCRQPRPPGLCGHGHQQTHGAPRTGQVRQRCDRVRLGLRNDGCDDDGGVSVVTGDR